MTTPFMEPGFDETVKAFIELNWHLDPAPYPRAECIKWAIKLHEEFGDDIVLELNDGHIFAYPGSGDPGIEHVWLSIDGCVFDPTVSIFGDQDIKIEAYNCSESVTDFSAIRQEYRRLVPR